jgi:hypothetical protein
MQQTKRKRLREHWKPLQNICSILKGIKKYITVLEVGMARNKSYVDAMAGYVDY